MKSIGKILSVVTAATLLGSMPVMASNGSQPVTKLLKDNPELDTPGIWHEEENKTNKNNIGNYKESDFIKEMYIREEKRGELPDNWYLHPYDLDASFYKPWSSISKKAGVNYRGVTGVYTNKGYTFTTDINPNVFSETNSFNAAVTIEAITAKAKRLVKPEMKLLSDPQKLQAVLDLVKQDMSYDYTLRVSTLQCHMQKINEGLGVCVDMSLLAVYLYDEIGLKDPGIAGVTVETAHTFNFVDIDGVRTYFDPTAIVTAGSRNTYTDPIEYVKQVWGIEGWGIVYPVEINDVTIGIITGAKN